MENYNECLWSHTLWKGTICTGEKEEGHDKKAYYVLSLETTRIKWSEQKIAT